MPVGVLLDFFVYPPNLKLFLLLRVVCSLCAFGLWVLLGTNLGHRYFRVFGMGWFILPSLFISLMIYFEEGIGSPYYAGLNLVLIGMAWAGQVDFIETIIATGLTLLMYGVACLAHGGGTISEYFNNFYFIMLTGIIVITGSYFLNHLRFREFALRAELDGNRRQLEESHAKLVELDRAKSSFFANVSHELRTPLTLLIGPLERLRHGDPPPAAPERQEMLDIMYNNAMRLLRLINDLLDLVRLDSGVLRVRRSKLALRPYIEGIVNSVSHMATQRNLNFSAPMPEQLNPEVYIDRDKLEKIILNLLFNSFKFTPEDGTVELKTELDGKWLTFTVRDSGKGIAAADLPRIFDRFWQAVAAATRNYQGVGIGLALVKELAEGHGGSVSVESEIGKGTTIRVIVDASDEDPSTLLAEAEPAETQAVPTEWLTQLYRRADLFPAHVITETHLPIAPAPTDQTKPLVLVADDEPDMRRFLVSQLSGNYNLLEARNGSEALSLAQEHDFALILLDLMMPGIDGITLTRHLRELERTATVPIVILTARADDDSKMQALDAGVTDFLTKPFASSELAARCRNLLFQSKLQLNLSRKTRELEAALEQIKNTEAQLVHQAKMASLGQLSSGLMHEINNPLNFANTAAHLLIKRLQKIPIEDREALATPLKDLQDGIRRVADIITGLRSFIHPDSSHFSQIALREIVDTSIRFVQIPAAEIALEVNVPDDLKVWGNANQLIHLVINLLQNSADSLREKGAIEKRIVINASLQSGRVLLTCEDNGKGIKASDKDKVFDAFFTTKPVGSGMGLGLNISYRIIQNHLGAMNVESQENEFCRFVINLNQTKPIS
jgi:signal transduction histidine kinase